MLKTTQTELKYILTHFRLMFHFIPPKDFSRPICFVIFSVRIIWGVAFKRVTQIKTSKNNVLAINVLLI